MIRAAGGVVVRGETVALVHRPRYDDWSLPKGKRDPGETDEQCAVREVEEEIGVRARLLRELLPTRYVDRRNRPKVVRYWLMEPLSERAFLPNDEIDQVAWTSVAEAVERLTYRYDAEVVLNVRLPFTSSSPGRT